MRNLSIDSSGRIALPRQAVKDIGSRPLEVKSLSSRHVLLAAEGEGEELILTGGLGEVGVADLLSFFNMFRKTGILRFSLPGGSKDLYFQGGEIVFAASSFPEEGLEEILCSLGKISRDHLQRLQDRVTARTTIGKLLVEKGAVSPKDLWLATRQQVEAIVYSLFGWHQGSYSFWSKSLEKDEIIRLSMSTQNLIMEGLRRADERGLYMRRIGTLDVIPVPGDRPAENLSALAQRIMRVIREGRYDVRTLLRYSGADEFDGLRTLYQLVEKGVVRLEEAPPDAVGGDLGEVLAVFNGALVALYRQVSSKSPDFRQEMQIFLRDLPQPFSYVFREAALREDGAIDGGRILANLAGLEEGDKKKLLAEALNELIFAECAAARQVLGAEASAELIRRVQGVTRRVKNLIGR